jgi:dienelactone hydrolase
MRYELTLLFVLACGDSRPPPLGDGGSVPIDAGAARPADSGGLGSAFDAGLVGDDAGPPVSSVDPTAPGPFAVSRSSHAIEGAMLAALVPAAPRALPLVVFKHGFQLATTNYAMLLERLASHGFVVVGVDTGGGLFGGPTNVDERDASIAAVEWALADAPFAAGVDPARIGVAGHSRGGKVAIMVAAADDRIGATLLLDPVNGCGPGAPYSATCPDVASAEVAGAVSTVVGVMGETNNASGGFMPCAPADQNYQTIFDAIDEASWAVEWTFTGADHMDFTDDGGGFAGSFCSDGPGDDAAIREDVKTLTVAFFRRHLDGDRGMDAWLSGASLPAGIVHEGP